MNAPPVLPGSIGRSAAEAWFGARLFTVLAVFDRQWLERNREAWLIEELAQKVDTEAMTYFVATEGDSSAIGKKVAKTGTQLF